MLVSNQFIEVSWHSQTREHYMSKGYKYTKMRDKFLVKAEDLSSTAKVKIKCDYCGKIFDKQWSHYHEVLETGKKDACYDCRHIKRYSDNIEQRQDSLYKKLLDAVCGKYEILTPKTDIVCNTTRIKYLCKIHGVQEARLQNLISGKGCPECNHRNLSIKYRMNCDEVENRIAELGSVLLNKEDYINNSSKNLKIICKECGRVFQTSLQRFMQHGGQVCPICSNKESKGERIIKHFLDKYNIKYIQEKMFKECKDVRMLPFDFYLPDYNLCIEFDGEQHFIDKGNFSTSLEYTQKHDKIKNDFCKNKGIQLLRIPYFKFSSIEKIIAETIHIRIMGGNRYGRY